MTKYYLEDSLNIANEKEYLSEGLKERVEAKNNLHKCFCKITTKNSSYDAPLISYKETLNKISLELWIDNKNVSGIIIDKVKEIKVISGSNEIKSFKLENNKLLSKKASYINVDIFKVKYVFSKE